MNVMAIPEDRRVYLIVLGLFGTAMGSGLGGNMFWLMELVEILFTSCPITWRVQRSIGEETGLSIIRIEKTRSVSKP